MSDDVKALIAKARSNAFSVGPDMGIVAADGVYGTPLGEVLRAQSGLVQRLADALEAAQQAPTVDAGGLVGEIRAAYVEYAESADFPTQKHYEEWKAAGGAEREFDSMVAEVEARGLESLIERVTDDGLVQVFGGEKFVSVALLVSEARAQQVREGNASTHDSTTTGE